MGLGNCIIEENSMGINTYGPGFISGAGVLHDTKPCCSKRDCNNDVKYYAELYVNNYFTGDVLNACSREHLRELSETKYFQRMIKKHDTPEIKIYEKKKCIGSIKLIIITIRPMLRKHYYINTFDTEELSHLLR